MLLLGIGRWPSSERRALPQFALKRRSEGEGGRQVGKISFIDLAGSERGADTYDNDRRAPPPPQRVWLLCAPVTCSSVQVHIECVMGAGKLTAF